MIRLFPLAFIVWAVSPGLAPAAPAPAPAVPTGSPTPTPTPAPLAADPIPPGPHPDGALIDNGVAHATILIPAEASEAERYAAEDLQRTLHRMTGVVLPIATDDVPVNGARVLLGDTRLTDAVVPPAERRGLHREGYVLRRKGRDLALAGGGAYGTIYAVSDLFHRLGARWYMPGDLGEVIPELSTVRFDALDVVSTPSFRMRFISRDVTWELRNRLNRIRSSRLPPAFTVWPGIYHTQQDILPEAPYSETHPEFFALIDGQRSTIDATRKLCNGTTAVAREIARVFADALRDNPAIDLLSLSPTDYGQWCECERCRDLDDPATAVVRDQRYSRRQMVLYNRVAEFLERDFPDQTIMVGAYADYTRPPVDPDLRAHRNLAVIIAHYDHYCLAHPIDDPDCRPNRKFVELLEVWRRHTPRIYIYEYYRKTNWLDLPWPIVHSVARDIPYYHSIGVEGLFTQYRKECIWSNFIVHYVAAQLLWDHTADARAIVDELYDRFYGKASEPMRRYHETLESRMAGLRSHVPGNALLNARQVFTRNVLSDMVGSLLEAWSRAEDPRVRARLRKVTVMTEYTIRMIECFRRYDQARDLQKQRLKRLREAYDLGKALIDDVTTTGTEKRFEGVAGGRFFKDQYLMGRVVNRMREQLETEGVIEGEAAPTATVTVTALPTPTPAPGTAEDL